MGEDGCDTVRSALPPWGRSQGCDGGVMPPGGEFGRYGQIRPWHCQGMFPPMLLKTAMRKPQGDVGSAVSWPAVHSEALLSHEPSQQGLPGVLPGALEGTADGRAREQMVQRGRVSERRGLTTQRLSSIGGGGEPFQVRVKGKRSQRRREVDDALEVQ